MLTLLNVPGAKIWTAENPVEIARPGMSQVEVNEQTGWDYAAVMSTILRADPDVIMLSEIRGRETAASAIEAALKGCLVVSAVHSLNAAETIARRMHYVKQDGQAVFRFAVRNTEEACRRILDRNGIGPEEIDLFVSHQANRRIILSAAEKLGLPEEKVVINIERFGNTTAATIPLALNDAVDSGRLKRGDLLLMVSVGAGFTVGSLLLRGGLKH